MPRKYFNSHQDQLEYKEKERLRKKLARSEDRAKVLEDCREEIERLSKGSELAAILAAKVPRFVPKPEEKFEIPVDTIDQKLALQSLNKEQPFKFDVNEIDMKMKLHKLTRDTRGDDDDVI